jgi:hypothetical protein
MTSIASGRPKLPGSAPEPARGRRRPFGVYIIALLQTVNAVSHGSGVISGVEDPLISTITDAASNTVATVLMVTGLLVATGLLLLKRWAWVATMLWVGAIMATELILFFRGDDPNYAVMAISIAQVFYLNLSDVQVAFGRRPATADPDD